MTQLITQLQARPASVSILGAVSGWASVDFLRSAQIVAALLAILVSVCALVLTAPKAIAQVRHWVYRKRLVDAASKCKHHEEILKAINNLERGPAGSPRRDQRNRAAVD